MARKAKLERIPYPKAAFPLIHWDFGEWKKAQSRAGLVEPHGVAGFGHGSFYSSGSHLERLFPQIVVALE